MSLTHQLFLQSLRELEGMGSGAFDNHRGPLIATLVDHAWREVPAYKQRLAPLIMDEAFDLARWAELPLLHLSELASRGPQFVARTVRPPAEIVENIQSLQLPIAFRSQLSRIAAECEREKYYEALGIDLSAPLAVLHPDHSPSTAGRGWSITFTRNHWSSGPVTASAPEQLDWLSATGSRLLRTNSVLARRLAKTAIEQSRGLALEVIIVADDMLPPDLEAAIDRAFGARVVHVVERPVLGPVAARLRSNGYTVPAGTAIVEVVDRSGAPVKAGEAGELVVSPLYEFATPLLRLITGITAIMPDDPGTMIGVRHLADVREPLRR